MLFRIAIALTTFMLLHGADKSATDVASAVESVRNQAPLATINLCLDNAAICQMAASKITGDRITGDRITGDRITGDLAAAGKASSLALPTKATAPVTVEAAFPLPPRRQSSVVQKEKLDRAGLVRVINASI